MWGHTDRLVGGCPVRKVIDHINILNGGWTAVLLAILLSLVLTLALWWILGRIEVKKVGRERNRTTAARIWWIFMILFAVLPPTLPGFVVSYLRCSRIPVRDGGGGTLAFAACALAGLIVGLPTMAGLLSHIFHLTDDTTVLTAESIGMQTRDILNKIIMPGSKGLFLSAGIFVFGRILGEYMAATLIMSEIGSRRGAFLSRAYEVFFTRGYLTVLFMEIGIVTVSAMVSLIILKGYRKCRKAK